MISAKEARENYNEYKRQFEQAKEEKINRAAEQLLNALSDCINERSRKGWDWACLKVMREDIAVMRVVASKLIELNYTVNINSDDDRTATVNIRW